MGTTSPMARSVSLRGDNTNVFFFPVFEPPAALRDPFNLWGAGKSPGMKTEPPFLHDGYLNPGHHVDGED